MDVYYSEFEPYAAEWLRNLIDAGHLPPGDVDERDIRDISADDINGYTQCHFFAGIGGWPYALRLAGWPDDRPVWTGSCPCQPFSAAGKRKGVEDPRHMFPIWAPLIEECAPATIFGEQVASKDGRIWLSGIRTQMEAMGYAVGAADLCSAGSGGDHIRQRLFWVANTDQGQCGWLPDGEERERNRPETGREQGDGLSEPCGEVERMADPDFQGSSGRGVQRPGESFGEGGGAALERSARLRKAGRLGKPNGAGSQQGRQTFETVGYGGSAVSAGGGLVPCADGKFRRFEPGSFPLAHALPRSVGPGSTKEQRVELMAAKANRIGRLRGYGNAIDPELASEFIKATNKKDQSHER